MKNWLANNWTNCTPTSSQVVKIVSQVYVGSIKRNYGGALPGAWALIQRLPIIELNCIPPIIGSVVEHCHPLCTLLPSAWALIAFDLSRLELWVAVLCSFVFSPCLNIFPSDDSIQGSFDHSSFATQCELHFSCSFSHYAEQCAVSVLPVNTASTEATPLFIPPGGFATFRHDGKIATYLFLFSVDKTGLVLRVEGIVNTRGNLDGQIIIHTFHKHAWRLRHWVSSVHGHYDV